ncbi:MAG: CinA family protein [Pseudomonadota bacterium]
MTQSQIISQLSADIIRNAGAKGLKIATAESCTAGLISAALTDHAGSSNVFEYGFVTYANAAKVDMLGVDSAVIAAHGAVSHNVARAMAVGALQKSVANIAVAVTGVAGPGGGSAQKPVGTVWFGLAGTSIGARTEHRLFPKGSRQFVRAAAAETALRLLLAGVAKA